MKAMQIKRAVLAAAIFAGAGMAHGVESALQVVYCKATIMGSGVGDVVSVTIPPTDGYFDQEGNPLTFWNVGNVPAGGVADSWHQEGGPGRFTARNAGNVGAYFYVTTAEEPQYHRFIAQNDDGYYNDNNSGTTYHHGKPISANMMELANIGQFGSDLKYLNSPSISPQELRRWGSIVSYHLAFTTDTMAKVPTWHSLDHRYTGGGWSTEAYEAPSPDEVAGYMGYVDAGDYLTFDLKFWAPRDRTNGENLLFTFCVEASAFPLWEHSRAVE